MSLVKRKELMNFECPKCGCNRVGVFYSMDDSTWLAKEEIRACPSCGSMVYNKVYTYPKPVNIPAKVPIIISNISCLPPSYSLLEKYYLYTRIN